MNRHVFVPSRLRAAREFRGLNQAKVAAEVGVSAATVSCWEKGQYVPTSQNVIEIASVLGFPITWFEQDELNLVDEHALSFRCQSRMTAALRNQSSRTWDFAALIAAQLRADFNLPSVFVPDYSEEVTRAEELNKPEERTGPEVAAQMLRDELRLGVSPIDNMVAVLESMGVLVFWTSIDSKTVDAYCHWDDNNPIVVLNINQRCGERSRFNAAHELGHLVLHRESIYRQNFEDSDEEIEIVDGETRQKREQEANAFASAFLLPEQSFGEDAPFQPEPNDFLDLKEKWKVSISAMIRRNYDLEYFSPDQYERAMTRLTMRGWRQEEPEPMDNEESIIHRQIFEALRADNRTAMDLAKTLHLNLKDLCTLMPLAERFPQKRTPENQLRKNLSQPTGKVLDFPIRKIA